MAQQQQVDHASLRVAAKDVTDARSNTEANLKELWGVVDDLAVAWKGQASAGFQQLMERWNTDANNLLGALGDIATLLGQSADTHQTNDEEQAQAMNKYQSILGS